MWGFASSAADNERPQPKQGPLELVGVRGFEPPADMLLFVRGCRTWQGHSRANWVVSGRRR